MIEGEFRKDVFADILREERKIGQGKILNIQEEKKDIEKAEPGQEIGILFQGSGVIQEGDVILAFLLEKKKAEF